MARRTLRRLIAVLAVAPMVVVCPVAWAETRPARTILTIHWGAEDFPGTPVLNAAIRDALQSSADAPILYFAEYLESEAFAASATALRDYIRQKYAGRRIDVVIANTTPSLDFALTFREELFPEAPILFLAGAPPAALAERTNARMTGIVSDVSFAETLELALTLQPSIRRVFVVAQAPSVETYRERIRAALAGLSKRVEITFIKERTVSGLLSAIRAIPSGSLILYTRFTPAPTDEATDTVEVVRLMAQVSPVPIYGPSSLYLGTGIVGGMVRDPRATGLRLGQMARQILDGKPVEAMPVETVRRVPAFDWRQLHRWGIGPTSLPAGSDVQFRTPTLWESYRGLITATIVVIVTQSVLIVGLLTERARRRRAERSVVAREAKLRSTYERIRELAGRLINAQEAVRSDIARDLHDDVCQRLVSVSIAVNALKGGSGEIQGGPTQQALGSIERDLGDVFDSIRKLSHELHSATLRFLGLAPALQSHCKEMGKRHDVRVTFTTSGDVAQLHPDLALCFFRIAQESLRNGIVHGHARQLTVSLTRTGDEVQLTISDDGSGFDLDAIRNSGGGLGLVSMEERTRLVGGDLHIVSASGQGTTIGARAPLTPSPVAHKDSPDNPGEAAAQRFPAAS